MTDRSAPRTNFTIDRDLAFKPADVFKAWADPAVTARWFSRSAGIWTERARKLNFRIAGCEREKGLTKDGAGTMFDAFDYPGGAERGTGALLDQLAHSLE